MAKKNNEFGFIFWLHIAAILLWYASPFLFSWKFILIAALVYHLHIFVFGGCILTIWQFGGRGRRFFYDHYLSKLGFNISKSTLRIVIDFVIPAIIFAAAIVWQIVLKRGTLL